jgi:general secretion pathway protein G
MKKTIKFYPYIHGFTMVELLIVVVMLGLLTLISGTAYISTMKTSRDGRRRVDLENIRGALEVYRSDNSTYPYVRHYPSASTPLSGILDPLSGKKYITMPKDPKTGLDYFYVSTDCSLIGGVNICNSYILASTLENPVTNPVPSANCQAVTVQPGIYACFNPNASPPTVTKCSYCLDPYGHLQ